MALEQELGLVRPVEDLAHRAVLGACYAASRLHKRASEFLRPYGLTDVQFNVLMLLKYQSGADGGLTQARLSRMMLVNRANITALVDRLERAGLVVRRPHRGDRRCHLVQLTPRAELLLQEVERPYIEEVQRVMGVLTEAEQRRLVQMLARVRENLGP